MTSERVAVALMGANVATSLGLAAADHWVACLVPAGVAVSLAYLLTEPERSTTMLGKLLCMLEKHDLRVVTTVERLRLSECRRCEALRGEVLPERGHTVQRVRRPR